MGRLIIIMGVSGCGKSTIAAALSKRLNVPWLEGDDFHPEDNIAKMSGGTPLTDADRGPWIDAMLEALSAHGSGDIILACSALTPFVQAQLEAGTSKDTMWILLSAPPALVAQRLGAREGHFMPPALLDSQFDALIPPKDAAVISAARGADTIVKEIAQTLRKKKGGS